MLADKAGLERLYEAFASQLIVKVSIEALLLFSLLSSAFSSCDNDTLRQCAKN